MRQLGSFGIRLLAGLLVYLIAAAPWQGVVAAPGEGPLRLVALGDSLTAGIGLPESQSFPRVLEAALVERGHDVVIVNAGVSGDTAEGGLERLDWSVPDETDGVILALGANDMLRGLDPAATHRTLDEILVRLEKRGIPVFLAGMLAGRNMGAAYTERFDAIYPALAERHAVAFYPFMLDGVAGDPKLNQRDGIHPNAEGVKVIVAGMLPAMEQFVARLR